jgi:hypothetical protein
VARDFVGPASPFSGRAVMTYLRIKCKCSKLLRVPSSLAGQKVACPSCKRAYRLSAEQFVASGQPAKTNPVTSTAKPKSVAQPPQLAPAASQGEGSTIVDPPPFSFDEELSSLSVLGIGGIPNSDDGDEFKLADEPASIPTLSVAQPPAANLQYASTKSVRSSAKTFADDGNPRRSFWLDALYSFIYPFKNGMNVATFFIVAGFLLMKIPLEWIGIYGMAGRGFIFGWVAAMYLSVIQDTATGSEDLPGIRMQDGILDDIVMPALRYVGALAVALLPSAIYGIAYGLDWLPDSLVNPLVPVVWLAVGLFLLPVVLMLFSFNAIGMVFRLDLIFATILRTFLPYMALCAMLFVVAFLGTIVSYGPLLVLIGLPSAGFLSFKASMALRIVCDVGDLYMTIVAMRMIGLYYLHFKSRFAIQME